MAGGCGVLQPGREMRAAAGDGLRHRSAATHLVTVGTVVGGSGDIAGHGSGAGCCSQRGHAATSAVLLAQRCPVCSPRRWPCLRVASTPADLHRAACARVACTGALAQGSACRRSRLPGRGQPWAAPCTGRQRAHPAVVLCRAARTAARATAALPNTWACRAPAHALRLLQHGATPSLPPTSPAKGLAQGPEGSFIWAEAGASPAEQSRAGSCRLLPPSACIAHATHALKPGPGTWQSQGRAKPPALGWWVWPGCSGEARLTGASDAPALGWALTVPFLCAPAEPP